MIEFGELDRWGDSEGKGCSNPSVGTDRKDAASWLLLFIQYDIEVDDRLVTVG